MSNRKSAGLFFITLFAALVASAVPAQAAEHEGKFARSHPRRDQVNDRLANQNKRIRHEVKEGEMTKTQAAALHKDDRQIRQEERSMASQDGGHITKQEQNTLNQQENSVSRQIGK
jgi:Skp family chaperone for outer membrane proteins